MPDHYNRLTQKQIALQNQNSIKDLTAKFESLEKKQEETNENVKRMLFYFNSDSETKSEGFIEKSNRHDVEIKDIQNKYRDLQTTVKVTSIIFGTISSIITFVILTWQKIKG